MNIVKKTLSDQIYDVLRKEIIQQNIPLGSKIVNRDLQQQFGVSSSPIRDAINKLYQDGLISLQIQHFLVPLRRCLRFYHNGKLYSVLMVLLSLDLQIIVDLIYQGHIHSSVIKIILAVRLIAKMIELIIVFACILRTLKRLYTETLNRLKLGTFKPIKHFTCKSQKV